MNLEVLKNVSKFDEGSVEPEIPLPKFFYGSPLGVNHLQVPTEATGILVRTIEELTISNVLADGLVEVKMSTFQEQEQVSSNNRDDVIEDESMLRTRDSSPTVVSNRECSPCSSSSDSVCGVVVHESLSGNDAKLRDSIQKHPTISVIIDDLTTDMIPPLEDCEESALPNNVSNNASPVLNHANKVEENKKKKKPLKLAAVFSTQPQPLPLPHSKTSHSKLAISFPNAQQNNRNRTALSVIHNPLNLPSGEADNSSVSSLDHSLTQQLKRKQDKVEKLEKVLLDEEFSGSISLDERLNDVDQAIECNLKHLMEKSWLKFNQKTVPISKANEELHCTYLKKLKLRALAAEQQKLQALCDLYC